MRASQRYSFLKGKQSQVRPLCERQLAPRQLAHLDVPGHGDVDLLWGLLRPSKPFGPLERCFFANFNPAASLRHEVAFLEADFPNVGDAWVLLRQHGSPLRRSVYIDHLVEAGRSGSRRMSCLDVTGVAVRLIENCQWTSARTRSSSNLDAIFVGENSRSRPCIGSTMG